MNVLVALVLLKAACFLSSPCLFAARVKAKTSEAKYVRSVALSITELAKRA